MPSRYKNTSIKTDKRGKRVFKPTIYPKIPIQDSDVFIYPIFGDRLDTLAQKYYGDVSLWWIIAKANGYTKGELAPDSERKLRIPTQIGDILESVYKSNS